MSRAYDAAPERNSAASAQYAMIVPPLLPRRATPRRAAPRVPRL